MGVSECFAKTHIHQRLSDKLWGSGTEGTCWAQSPVTAMLCVSVLTLLQGWSLYTKDGEWAECLQTEKDRPAALHRDNTPPAVCLAVVRMHPIL